MENSTPEIQLRNLERFKALKECTPQGYPTKITQFGFSSYEVSPNTNRFLCAKGYMDIVEGGKTTRMEARWNVEGKCISPIFTTTEGRKVAFIEGDLINEIIPE